MIVFASCTPQEGSKTKKTNQAIADATPPIAVLSNVSAVVNLNNPNLNIFVTSNTPDDVVSYKYKIGNSALDCSLSTGYSAETSISTPITASVTNFSSHTIVNNTKICVVGIDASKNQQSFSKATTLSWITDLMAPVATAGNAPSGTSPSTLLNISVSAVVPSDIKKYKYKVGLVSTTVCSNSTGYSNDRAVSVNITDDISAIPDGAIRVCVVGIDGVGNQQGYSAATAVMWNKDTTSPLITFSGSPVGTNTATTLNIVIGSSVPGELVSYSYKVGLDASTDCSSSIGYSADVNLFIPITTNISLLADGLMKVCAIGTDVYGNQQPLALASAVTWTKDTSASPAVLVGAPSGSSSLVNLNISVSAVVPADIHSYKYKLGAASGIDCSVATGYSAAIPAITPITNDISAFGDVLMRLCVIAIDNLANEQSPTFATVATWTKDLSPPVAILTNAPTALNVDTGSTLNIIVNTVNPGDLFSYRYKYGTASLDCSDPLLYSSDVLASVYPDISDDVIALNSNSAVNNSKICVLAKDAQGNEQALASATSASWITDMDIPVANLGGAPTGNTPNVVLNIAVSAVEPADLKNYKYKIVSTPANCNLASGYSALILPGTPITDNLTAHPEGLNVLCVIAFDFAGNAQASTSATKTSWTKIITCNNAAASFGGGSGAIADPYLINNLAQLNNVRTNLNCSYKLMTDIDLTAQSFAPLGTNSSNSFSGNFDGNGHTISNWTQLTPATNHIGFFGYTNNTTNPIIIKDLSILNANISGNQFVGILVGYASERTVIMRVKTSGAVSSTYYGGGLAGNFTSSPYYAGIFSSSSSATVNSQYYSGGLIGNLYVNNYSQGIVNSFATGSVTGEQSSGGLVGNYYASESDFGIRNSYSSGNVSATIDNAGGLVGNFYGEDGSGAINSFTISSTSSPSNTGGVAGYNEFYTYSRPVFGLRNVYWDVDNSGQGDCTAPGPVYTECFGVNASGMESSYFFDALNPPFRISGTQYWNTSLVWNFSGSSLPTLRANSAVSPSAGSVIVSEATTSNIGIFLQAKTFDTGYENLTYVIVTAPTKGILSSVSSEGYLTYTKNDIHDFGYYADSFTYKVVDSRGLESSIATVNIVIQPGCDPDPVIDFTGGTGVALDPYQISTPEQLINIHKAGYCNYQLLGDIDLSGEIFPPFGSAMTPYNKTFDGNNYKIMNWTHTDTEIDYASGFFRNINAATIKNLHLENVNLNSSSGTYYSGILAGYSINSQIINTSTSGTHTGRMYYSGGLIGSAQSTTIERSHSTANLSAGYHAGGLVGYGLNIKISSSYYNGNISATGSNVGGIVGYFQHTLSTTEIKNSYSAGTISAWGYVGGFVGSLQTSAGISSNYSIINSYSSANVRDFSASAYAGGFAGNMSVNSRSRGISNSFAAGLVTNGRGFVRNSTDGSGPNSPVNNSYWDLFRTNQALCNQTANTPLGCTGVNSTNSAPNYFFNNTTNGPLPFWDFTTIWRTNSGGYPTLRP